MAVMNDDTGCPIFLLMLLSFILGAGLAFGVGAAVGTHLEHQKAIEAGVGRWTIDAATGSKEFVYGK